MITVKFFGMMGVSSGISKLQFNESEYPTLDHILVQIEKDYPILTKRQTGQSVIFLNNKAIIGGRRLSTTLKDGDQLSFLSPAGGG
jgi:molybdopterin converting factor small subunit